MFFWFHFLNYLSFNNNLPWFFFKIRSNVTVLPSFTFFVHYGPKCNFYIDAKGLITISRDLTVGDGKTRHSACYIRTHEFTLHLLHE